MSKRLYLAYGSNLNIRQMRFRCPNARIVGTAEIDGYELLFKGSKSGSYLTIEQKENSKVPVAVWEVTPTDEQALDRYEGYPNFYYKKDMQITYTGIKSKKQYEADAFVYIMHEDRPLGLPSRAYVETCLSGYRNFRFNAAYLMSAIYKSDGGKDYD